MDPERLERIRLLWEGDATQDTSLLWRILVREAEDLDDLVRRIIAAGETDPAVEIYQETAAQMLAVAAEELHK